jgi:hypothetical protein
MALFNTFGVNRWLKFEVLRDSDGAGANDNDRDDRPPSNSGGYATSTPPKPAPTPAPTNQYSSAAYVDSQGREFGQTYSSDPNQKPTQVDKITDVAGYGQGDGNDNDNDPAPVAATPAPPPVAATPSTTYSAPTLEDQATALGISTINNDRYMSDEAFAQGLQRKIDLENRHRAFEEELRIKEEADAATPKESTPGTPVKSIPEGFKPPDGPAGSALQTWTNMDTGEEWTANTGGWTAEP